MKYTRGDTIVSSEKLWFLQKRHAAKYAAIAPENVHNPSHDLTSLAVKPILTLLSHRTSAAPEQSSFYLSLPEEARGAYIQSIVYADAQSLNYTNPASFLARNTHFFVAPTVAQLVNSIPTFKLRRVPTGLVFSVPPETLLLSFGNFSEIPESRWNTAEIKGWINSIIDQGSAGSLAELGDGVEGMGEAEMVVKKAWAKLAHGYVRWAIVAGMPGPGGAETMQILGKRECVRRLEVARDVVVGRIENEGFGSMDG
jgi:glutamyl-tRNA synthetase